MYTIISKSLSSNGQSKPSPGRLLNIIICFFFFTKIGYSQTDSLGNYDFSKGEYSLIIQPIGYDFVETIKYFEFTDDINVLNQYQALFGFYDRIFPYRCDNGYQVLLCKNGNIVENRIINLNYHSDLNYHSAISYSSRFGLSLKDGVYRFKKFNDREEAIKYYYQIIGDTEFIFAEKPDWLNYEGEFVFLYNSNEINSDKIMFDLTDTIAKIYPDEKFEISWVHPMSEYSETGFDFWVHVKCNKSFDDNFKLYRKVNDGWQLYPLVLNTYWKK